MKVKQLIKELKKMPQNLEVEVAMYDNAEFESVGNISTADHFVKDDYDIDGMSTKSRMIFEGMPDEYVILRG
jgi:hypothetical protein